MTVSIDDVQQRAAILFMVLQKKKPKEIHDELVATLDDNALRYATVKKWTALFKDGRESIDDDLRSGRSTSAVTDESVKDVEKFVEKDWRVSVPYIASEMSIFVGFVETILHDRLNLFKASVNDIHSFPAWRSAFMGGCGEQAGKFACCVLGQGT